MVFGPVPEDYNGVTWDHWDFRRVTLVPGVYKEVSLVNTVSQLITVFLEVYEEVIMDQQVSCRAIRVSEVYKGVITVLWDYRQVTVVSQVHKGVTVVLWVYEPVTQVKDFPQVIERVITGRVTSRQVYKEDVVTTVTKGREGQVNVTSDTGEGGYILGDPFVNP